MSEAMSEALSEVYNNNFETSLKARYNKSMIYYSSDLC